MDSAIGLKFIFRGVNDSAAVSNRLRATEDPTGFGFHWLATPDSSSGSPGLSLSPEKKAAPMVRGNTETAQEREQRLLKPKK